MGFVSNDDFSLIKKNSQITENGRWNKYIDSFIQDKYLEDITTLDLLLLRRNLEEKNLSAQSIYHCLSLLRRVINKTAEWNNNNQCIPSFKKVMPKFDNRRQRFLNDTELLILLNQLLLADPSKNWYDISLFAVNTGLRRSEIFNLTLNDIDFSSRTALIMDTKSGKNRNIRLNNISFNIVLKKIYLLKGHQKIFYAKNPRVFRKAVKDSGLNEGITDLRQKIVFHSFRHTFASWLVQSGFPLALVSQMLGHSSIQVTMRYAHLAPSQENQAVDLIGCRLEKNLGIEPENYTYCAEHDANSAKSSACTTENYTNRRNQMPS